MNHKVWDKLDQLGSKHTFKVWSLNSNHIWNDYLGVPSMARCWRYCHNPNLELVTKVRACEGAGQEWSLGVTFHVLESVGECEGMNLHTPKWTPTLGVEVPMDSQIFRQRLQGSKPIGMKSSLYHWKISWNLDVQNGLAWPIWILKTQVMAKRRVRSQIVNLTPDH